MLPHVRGRSGHSLCIILYGCMATSQTTIRPLSSPCKHFLRRLIKLDWRPGAVLAGGWNGANVVILVGSIHLSVHVCISRCPSYLQPCGEFQVEKVTTRLSSSDKAVAGTSFTPFSRERCNLKSALRPLPQFQETCQLWRDQMSLLEVGRPICGAEGDTWRIMPCYTCILPLS